MEADGGRDIGKIRLSVLHLCEAYSSGLMRGLEEDACRVDCGVLRYPPNVRFDDSIEYGIPVHTSEPCLRDIVANVGVVKKGKGKQFQQAIFLLKPMQHASRR